MCKKSVIPSNNVGPGIPPSIHLAQLHTSPCRALLDQSSPCPFNGHSSSSGGLAGVAGVSSLWRTTSSLGFGLNDSPGWTTMCFTGSISCSERRTTRSVPPSSAVSQHLVTLSTSLPTSLSSLTYISTEGYSPGGRDSNTQWLRWCVLLLLFILVLIFIYVVHFI